MEVDSQNFASLKKVVRHLQSDSFQPLITWKQKLCMGKDLRLFENVIIKSFKADWSLSHFQQFCDTLGIRIEIGNKEISVDFNVVQQSPSKTSQKKFDLLFSSKLRRRTKCSIKVNTGLNRHDLMESKILELHRNLQEAHNIQKLILEEFKAQQCT